MPLDSFAKAVLLSSVFYVSPLFLAWAAVRIARPRRMIRAWRRERLLAVVVGGLLLALPAAAIGSDDWVVSTPTAEGIDANALADLTTSIRAGQYGAIDSLLIARHGRLAFEEYFGGYGPEDLHRMYSVTKSVTSLLVGIAGDAGLVGDPSVSLWHYFPDVPAAGSELKRDIRLEHVLAMTAGFAWNEHEYAYTDPRNPVAAMVGSPDWIRHVLELPMAAAPGSTFRYNSGLTVVLSGVLQSVTGVRTETFAAERLFAPLGIERWSWESTASGLTNTGWGLFLRPRDAATLGQLVLEGGVRDGRQVVSQAWVERSTAPLVDVNESYGYGYQWWVLKANPPSREVEVRLAWGYGGQFIFVLPALELLVVTTSSNYDSPQESDPIRFLVNEILPAVQ